MTHCQYVTITRAIQGSNVNTMSGYLEEWGVPKRHDSYTQAYTFEVGGDLVMHMHGFIFVLFL